MKKCDICGYKTKYDEKHDAYYCPQCNEWIEKPCSDSECDMCIPRPDKPVRKRNPVLDDPGQGWVTTKED